jgi:hypothetical protein
MTSHRDYTYQEPLMAHDPPADYAGSLVLPI